jgi:hypothetical protein
LLREQDSIVGISGYGVRPAAGLREKSRVSAFTSANIDKILTLRPNLLLMFSDLQADIAADLISSIPFAPSDGAASTTKVSPAGRRANRRSRLWL